MSSIHETRRQNLKNLIEKFSKTNKEFSAKVGKTPQQISQILSGARNMGEKIARDIEAKAELEKGYLDIDHNVDELKPAIKTKRIPVLSWVQAGNPHDTGDCDYSETMVVEEYIPDGCFGLRVRGDSMVPEFHEGDPIIVNPNICTKPGDFVIARVCSVAGTCETTLKQYALVGVDEYGREVFELRPLNSLYAPLRSDKLQIEILGVVIENRKKYR